MPDVLHALFQGLGSGSRQLVQTSQSFVDRPTIAADDSPAAEPIGWSDLKRPLDRFAPKVAYRFAQSYPTMTGGVVGGVVGGRVGAFAGPYGLAAGAIVGGSLGAAALSAAQTLGPAFAAELQKTPNDPEGAWKRAWRQAEISGAFSGASWAVFPARFFQGPVKQLLFQTFAVQPAISVAERTTRNVAEGKPATEGLGEAYGEGVVGTLTPAVGHAAVNRILSTHGGHHRRLSSRKAAFQLTIGRDTLDSFVNPTAHSDYWRVKNIVPPETPPTASTKSDVPPIQQRMSTSKFMKSIQSSLAETLLMGEIRLS